MDFSEILMKMLLLMLTIGVGYGANKKGAMNKEFSSKLSKFLLDVTVPAVLLSAGMSGDISFTPLEVLKLFGIAALLFAVMGAIAFVVPLVIRAKPEEAGTYRVLSTFSNNIFMGYPVVTAFFGASAVIYPAIYAIPFNVALFSFGPMMLGSGKKGKFDWKQCLNSGTVFSLLALVLILLPVEMPRLVKDLCSSLGSATSPLALMIIGSNLADMPLGKIFGEKKMYFFALFRLIVQPVITYFLLGLIITDEVALGCAVIIAGLPAASMATLLAAKYGGHEELASRGVMMTTLLSSLTIPAVMYLLFR